MPDYHIGRFTELSPEWLMERGIKTVLLDLDNTLAGYRERTPSDDAMKWLESLSAAGIIAAVVSNGGKRRVSAYCGKLPHISRARKPRPDAILDMIKRLKAEPAYTLMVGDQYRTDIRSGKRAGVLTAWVKPLRPNTFHKLRYAFEKLLQGKRRK